MPAGVEVSGSKNVFNLAIKGSFDDCQRLVKDMFGDKKFRISLSEASGDGSDSLFRRGC